jgi:hypothetical protein
MFMRTVAFPVSTSAPASRRRSRTASRLETGASRSVTDPRVGGRGHEDGAGLDAIGHHRVLDAVKLRHARGP